MFLCHVHAILIVNMTKSAVSVRPSHPMAVSAEPYACHTWMEMLWYLSIGTVCRMGDNGVVPRGRRDGVGEEGMML